MFAGLGGLGGFGAFLPLYAIFFVINIVIQLVTGGFGDVFNELFQGISGLFGTQM